AEQQPADDGQTQRLAHLAALAAVQQQRQGAENGRQGGHQDRPEAQQAGLADGRQGSAALALQLQRQVDHQDGVLHDDADQQEQAQQRDQAELAPGELDGQQGADAGRGQGGEDGQ